MVTQKLIAMRLASTTDETCATENVQGRRSLGRIHHRAQFDSYHWGHTVHDKVPTLVFAFPGYTWNTYYNGFTCGDAQADLDIFHPYSSREMLTTNSGESLKTNMDGDLIFTHYQTKDQWHTKSYLTRQQYEENFSPQGIWTWPQQLSNRTPGTAT